VLARNAVCLAAKPDDRVAQLAIVHVERARPRDGRRVDAQRIGVVNRCVERGREQVMRRGHRVKVAVEVEVDVLHRPDLRVAAAGAATFHAEHRAHRRLAQTQHHLLADLPEPHRQRDAGGRLALARLGRGDGGDDHELAVRARGETIENRESNLAAILA
jgi:hypothetical protein